MLFPDVERVIYKSNPLHEVIVQLKYPSILRIDTQEPADFQDEIRRIFPIYREKRDDNQIPDEILKAMPADFATLAGVSKNYEFLTANEAWRINLTRDFIALTTSSYQSWDEFSSFLKIALDALIKVYQPAFFIRIGLRYQNIIQKSKWGISKNTNWSDLLNPSVLGLLNDKLIRSEIRETLAITNIAFVDIESFVNIRHGLVKHNPSNEICYLLDNDFYTDKRTEIQDGFRILNEFNTRNRRLFRWCIKPRLHKAMGNL